MDQKIRTNGALFTALMLGACSVISLIIGVGIIASYPDPIWWAGLLLLLCSLLVGYGSISGYRSSAKEKKLRDEQMQVIRQQGKSLQEIEDKFEILAIWTYSVGEWKSFLKRESNQRSSGTVLETAVIVSLGTLGLYFLKRADWITAFVISLIIGVVYGGIKYLITMSSIKLDEGKLPEVIVTNQSIIVNSRMNRFYGNNRWLGKVEIKETTEFNILEITYCWLTRGGQTFDEIRVPIPKGSLKEAIFLQEKLMSGKNQLQSTP